MSRRDWDDAHLINTAMDVHGDDPEFGYRLIAVELIDAMGFQVVENRVARMSSLKGNSSTVMKRRGSGKKSGPASHDDLVNRDFHAESIHVKRVVDIMEHSTAGAKAYLCAIKDCASKRILGYAIDSRMTSELALNALRMTIILRFGPAGAIVHSYRGGQFRLKKFAITRRSNVLVGSMGRVASAGDNAAMESFFVPLGENILDRKQWDTREEIRLAIITWIERTNHRRRRQRGLGKITAMEFAIIYSQVARAA